MWRYFAIGHEDHVQWNAIERHAREHPEDPDAPELVASLRRTRDAYLAGGRDELGWAIYVFQKDPFPGQVP